MGAPCWGAVWEGCFWGTDPTKAVLVPAQLPGRSGHVPTLPSLLPPPPGRKVENFLNRALAKDEGVEVLPHHAAIADGQREANLRRFLATPATAGGRGDRRRGGGQREGGGQAAERLVLVCTDRASRGVDSAFVEHVVLFDLPRDPSEYLRRVGRTTRGAAGTGVVSVLALGRQVKLAKEIIDRNQGGLALHRVPVALPVAAQEQAQASDDAERLRADLAAAAAARAAGSAQQQQQGQQQEQQEQPEQQGDEQQQQELAPET